MELESFVAAHLLFELFGPRLELEVRPGERRSTFFYGL